VGLQPGGALKSKSEALCTLLGKVAAWEESLKPVYSKSGNLQARDILNLKSVGTMGRMLRIKQHIIRIIGHIIHINTAYLFEG
jgi:hypothetical protein